MTPDEMVRKAEGFAGEAEDALDTEAGEHISAALVALAQFWLNRAKLARSDSRSSSSLLDRTGLQ